MDKAPAFQFFPADWLDCRVLRMRLESQGAYIRILCHMWRDSSDQCSIENSTLTLSRLLSITNARCTRIISEIQWSGDPIFEEVDGRFISRRLERVRAQQDERRKDAAESGKRGAEKRWGAHSDPNRVPTVSPMAKDGSSSSSSSSSASTTAPAEEEKKEKSAPSARARALVEKAVGLWNFGRAAGAWIRLTPARVTKAAARLRDGFTEDQLIAVLKALKESEWHQGGNERGWRAPGPEWVWKSQEKVEEWLGKIASPQKGGTRAPGSAVLGKFALRPGELEERVRERTAERDGHMAGSPTNGTVLPAGTRGEGGDAENPRPREV